MNLKKHLFHSDENLKSDTLLRKHNLEIPLRKKKNSNNSNTSSMIALNQERLKIGQVVLNIELFRDFLSSTLRFFRKQSYLLSLISMMAWSILFHSFLTLVLLIMACLIWVMPSSRKWCLRTSPIVLAYSIGLLCLEFIYGLQLTNDELPEKSAIGLVRAEIPFFVLVTKVVLFFVDYFLLCYKVLSMKFVY